MAHAIWKGAISFGLVHVPVALYPASRTTGIDFDWLDDRSMDPVGYKRINKRTGKEVPREHIVRGVKHGDEYVIVKDEEIKAAYPKTTQTIEIEAFVKATEIPFVYLDRPYFLEPQGRSEKVYSLLREALAASGKVGIARVVIATKEHLAALIPDGPMLLLNTLHWADEMRSAGELTLPSASKSTLKPGELKMAQALIDDMSDKWDKLSHEDRFQAAVMKLVETKLKQGKTERVEPLEKGEVPSSSGSNVVDLSDLLKRSLGGKRETPKDKAQAKPAAKRGAAKKRA